MSVHVRRRFATLIPFLWLAACASSGAEPADWAAASAAAASGLAIVEIVHNDPAQSAVTVLIEPENGIRATLGIVDPGQTKQFTYNAQPGNYRLIIPGGKTSERFRLSNREIATWDMQTNRVRPRNKT